MSKFISIILFWVTAFLMVVSIGTIIGGIAEFYSTKNITYLLVVGVWGNVFSSIFNTIISNSRK